MLVSGINNITPVLWRDHVADVPFIYFVVLVANLTGKRGLVGPQIDNLLM